ncbi:MAG: hypothetical protein RSB24_07010, partial [Akkermansia sp.]
CSTKTWGGRRIAHKNKTIIGHQVSQIRGILARKRMQKMALWGSFLKKVTLCRRNKEERLR